MTIAEQYPPREQNDGTVWWKPAPRSVMGRDGAVSDKGAGWTSQPGYADPSYGVGDGKGTSFLPSEAE